MNKPEIQSLHKSHQVLRKVLKDTKTSLLSLSFHVCWWGLVWFVSHFCVWLRSDTQTVLRRSQHAASTCSRHTCSKINPPSPFFLLTSPSPPLSFWISNTFFVYCFSACLYHINRCNQVWITSVSRPPTACRLKSLIVLCWIRLMRFDILSCMPFFFFTNRFSLSQPLLPV